MNYSFARPVSWALLLGASSSFAAAPRCPAQSPSGIAAKAAASRLVSPGVFRLFASELRPLSLPDFSLVRNGFHGGPMDTLGDIGACDHRKSDGKECFKFFVDQSEVEIDRKQLTSKSASHDIKYLLTLGQEDAQAVELHPGQRTLSDGSVVEGFSVDLEFGNGAATPWGPEHIEDVAFQPGIPGGSSQMLGLRRKTKSGSVLWSYVYLHKAPGVFVANDSPLTNETILSLDSFSLLDTSNEALAASLETTYCKAPASEGGDYRMLDGTAFEIDLDTGLPIDRANHVVAIRSPEMLALYRDVFNATVAGGRIKEADMPLKPSKFNDDRQVRSMAESQQFSDGLLAAIHAKYFSRISK